MDDLPFNFEYDEIISSFCSGFLAIGASFKLLFGVSMDCEDI